ncbi:MAG: hypothetical protein J2P56_03425 [Verrucomicrobia bacterium]|nr:hypothetical protein [Verrucomicrobiota bacterium]
MVKRALCVAVGLLGALSSVLAQQAHHSVTPKHSRSIRMLSTPLSLNLYQPQVAANRSLLLHNGSVPLWLDGPQLSSAGFDPGYSFTSQWVHMGFMSSDLIPAELLNVDQGPMPRQSTGRVHAADGKDLGAEGKDLPNEMLGSSLNPVYVGGEVGFLYGRWSGKGGGDMWETYVEGTVGNDKFQITAGASYDEWNGNGRSLRFRSFAAPR